MTTYKIAVIVGSLRKDSINRKLANAIVKLAPADFTFEQIPIADLPLYNQDEDATPVEAVIRFRDAIREVQGVIFVTPEYNRSIPGVLKNAIDQGSRPYGKSVWAKKAAGIIGAAGGALGTCLAQQHLRNILAHLNMPTLGQPEAFVQIKDGFFDDQGNIGPASKDFLQGWMDAYVAWVKRFANE